MTSNGCPDHPPPPVALTILTGDEKDADNGLKQHVDYHSDKQDKQGVEEVDAEEEEERRDELGVLMEGKKQIQLHNGEVLEVGRDPRPPNGECGGGGEIEASS